MKQIVLTVVLLFSIFAGYNCSSEALPQKDTATLTIFHTNDIMGYLTPCG